MPLTQQDWRPYKKDNLAHGYAHTHTQEEQLRMTAEDRVVQQKPRNAGDSHTPLESGERHGTGCPSQPSEGSNPPNTLVLGF